MLARQFVILGKWQLGKNRGPTVYLNFPAWDHLDAFLHWLTSFLLLVYPFVRLNPTFSKPENSFPSFSSRTKESQNSVWPVSTIFTPVSHNFAPKSALHGFFWERSEVWKSKSVEIWLIRRQTHCVSTHVASHMWLHTTGRLQITDLYTLRLVNPCSLCSIQYHDQTLFNNLLTHMKAWGVFCHTLREFPLQ